MKKKKEGKVERKPKFNNFQITWNDCNSEGKFEKKEESVQMAFMAIGDDEVITCNFQIDSDGKSDDDVNSFIERLHSNLKDSYARNKELKQKINFLIQDNASLFRLNKNLKAENDNLNKVETNLYAELDRKIKLCEMFKREQGEWII